MSAAAWFWLGIVINVPISITIGLSLPKIQRWFEDRGRHSHEKKIERQRDEYERVIYHAFHPDMLIAKTVHIIIWLCLYTFFFTTFLFTATIFPDVVKTTLELYPNRPSLPLHQSRVLMVLGSGAVLISVVFLSIVAAMLFQEVRSISKLYINVRYFSSFVESIADELRDRERERFVINARMDRAVPGSRANISFMRELAERQKKSTEDATRDLTPDSPSAPSAPQS